MTSRTKSSVWSALLVAGVTALGFPASTAAPRWQLGGGTCPSGAPVRQIGGKTACPFGGRLPITGSRQNKAVAPDSTNRTA